MPQQHNTRRQLKQPVGKDVIKTMVLPNENFTIHYFKATLKGFCISIKCSVSLKMNCYQAYFSHLSGLNVNQQQAVLSYLYGAKVLLASNCKSTVNLFSM